MQAPVGSRLQTSDPQNATNTRLALPLKSSMSGVRNLDYTTAAITLNQQMTALQAARASFSRIQGLSLFNYIQ